MTDLAQLIAKLEAASEGSRELDAAMFRAIGAPLPDKFANLNLELTWGPDGSAYMPVGEMQVRYDPPAYTLSIDAIVALIERKLPGWHLQVEKHPGNPAHLRWGSNQDNVDDKVARGRTRNGTGKRIDVDIARLLRSEGHSNVVVARMFNVRPQSVERALRR